MAYVESFRELEVYKVAKELSGDVFELTKTFPKEERYSLTDQIRRSSRSVWNMLKLLNIKLALQLIFVKCLWLYLV